MNASYTSKNRKCSEFSDFFKFVDFFLTCALFSFQMCNVQLKKPLFTKNAQTSKAPNSAGKGASGAVSTVLESPRCVESELFWIRVDFPISGGVRACCVGAFGVKPTKSDVFHQLPKSAPTRRALAPPEVDQSTRIKKKNRILRVQGFPKPCRPPRYPYFRPS